MAQGLYHTSLGWELAAPRVLARCCGALGAGLFLLGAFTIIELATGSVLPHFPG
jgi:hypothetical protein